MSVHHKKVRRKDLCVDKSSVYINKCLHVRLSMKPKHAFVIVISRIHLLLCAYAFVCGRPCCLETMVQLWGAKD